MKYIKGLKLFFLSSVMFIIYSCSPEQSSVNKNKPLTEKTPGTMVMAPEKAEMLLLTGRPPNLETPLVYFLQDFTPNDVFFAHWHLSDLPTQINSETFHLKINGNVKKELTRSLNDLKTKFKIYTPPVSDTSVINQIVEYLASAKGNEIIT